MLRRDPHISQQAAHGSTGVWRSIAYKLRIHIGIVYNLIFDSLRSIIDLMKWSHIADVGHVRRLHGSQHHYHLSHRDSMHYSYCGMLHRSALLHTVFQSVGLMNQIRYVVNVGLDIFHPIPFHHSNMLRSDCHRRIRRPHGHMLYRTIHQGVGLISHICHLSTTAKNTPFL